MKICDRCFINGKGSVPSVDVLEQKKSFETFDLCKSCLEQVREFITIKKVVTPAVTAKKAKARTKKK